MAVTSSSGLSQVPLSDLSDPPTDLDLPDSSQRPRICPRSVRLQTPNRISRVVRTLPFELQEQSRILFEETLYTQALRLLQILFTAGYSNINLKEWRPAFVAPPAQLALIATLAVHPNLNTKTRNEQKLAASVEAIQYLRLVQSLVGPVDSKLSKAYRFPERTNSTRRGIFIRPQSHGAEEFTEINSPLTSSDSLWTQAKDFWSVVGWGFNCSVRIRKRWEIWAAWLDHVISVLNEDWLLHCANPDHSLIVSYLRGHDGRRVMRAVFADGAKPSLQEFPEIWKNEAAEPKVKQRVHEKVELNFELDHFGDYTKDSSDEDEVDKINKIFEHGTAPPDAHMDNGPLMGGAGSIQIRMKLLALLSEVASQLPESFFDADTFVEGFVTCIRHLSPLTFQKFLSVFELGYFQFSHASLLAQSVACSFVESAAPQLPTEELSHDILSACYLPWTANTTSVADNAKLSICLETLVRLYTNAYKGETWNTKTLKALEQGIENREQKAQRAGRTRAEPDARSDLSDLERLTTSGRRLRLLAKIADLQQQEA